MSTEMQTKVQASPAQSFTPAQTGLLQRQSTLCNTPGLVEDSGRDKEKLTLQRSSVYQAGTTTVPRFGHDFSRVRVHSTGPGMIQAKLKINEPGDIYEQEADRVADAVMRMEEPRVQRQPDEELVQKKPVITPLVQRQSEEEEEFLQTKELPGQSPEVMPALSSRIQSLRGGGQMLPESARTYFEPRFGYDFSQVRVHADSRAAEAAQVVNARAFTIGRDVVFGEGQYAPGTTAGRRLIGHELTHVVQQRGNTHVSGVGLIQRDLQRIEDLLREEFIDPNNPRLYERRRSLNLEFKFLFASDAKVLLDQIMSPTKDDIISERFQTLKTSTRRQLLLILFNKLEHIDAEILHMELTQAPKTLKEKQLQARFKGLIKSKKKIREELLDCLRSRFLSAHKAPSGEKTPWVNLKPENFKTTGSISPDNNCKICVKSKYNKLGVNWSVARNTMELRGDVSGHQSNAKYEFKRTKVGGIWIKFGSWQQIDYIKPGTDDDTLGNDDEHLTPHPVLNHIYVVDAPGFDSLNPADVYHRRIIPNGISEYVSKLSFVEHVEVKLGTGRWTIASTFFDWHSIVWLEKVKGKWQRKKDALNEIRPGFIPVGEHDVP